MNSEGELIHVRETRTLMIVEERKKKKEKKERRRGEGKKEKILNHYQRRHGEQIPVPCVFIIRQCDRKNKAPRYLPSRPPRALTFLVVVVLVSFVVF